MAARLAPGVFYGRTRVRYRGQGLLLTDVVHEVGRALPVHSHEHAYFALLLGGRYEEECGRTSLAYGAGTLGFHPPHLAHRDRLTDGGGRFFVVELESRWLERVSEIGTGSWRPALLAPPAAWLAQLLREESRRPSEGSALAIEALVTELLVLAARQRGREARSRPAWLDRVRDAIADEPLRPWTLAALADEAGVHPLHLARATRRFEGKPLGHLLREARILAACGLLRKAVPLAEIALQAGFADQSHFTRVFRRVTGTTPAAFRRAQR